MEKEKLPNIAFAYKGVFDFAEIYKAIHEFLESEGYVASDYKGIGLYYLYEVDYMEVGDSPKNYLIHWAAKKPTSDEFFERRFDILFRGTAISKTEIMFEGKKEKMDKGEITIEIKSYLNIDVPKMRKSHWFVKHFKGTFNEIIKERKEKELEELGNDLNDLYNLIKRYFKLKGDKVVAEVGPVKKG